MNETPTRNIAKSGIGIISGLYSPFQRCIGLIVNHSQSTSCHIAKRYSALEEWKSRIILLTLRYENKDTAYKPINSTLH